MTLTPDRIEDIPSIPREKIAPLTPSPRLVMGEVHFRAQQTRRRAQQLSKIEELICCSPGRAEFLSPSDQREIARELRRAQVLMAFDEPMQIQTAEPSPDPIGVYEQIV